MQIFGTLRQLLEIHPPPPLSAQKIHIAPKASENTSLRSTILGATIAVALKYE